MNFFQKRSKLDSAFVVQLIEEAITTKVLPTTVEQFLLYSPCLSEKEMAQLDHYLCVICANDTKGQFAEMSEALCKLYIELGK